MRIRRLTWLLVMAAALLGGRTWAGTIYHAYPGDNLNAMDSLLTYGDTLVIHEGTYVVNPDGSGGRMWMTDKHGDDPNTPQVEWITIKGAEGEGRPRLYYALRDRNMIDINGTSDHIRIQHLEIEGGSFSARLGPGNFSHIVFEDLHIHNSDSGVNLSGVDTADQIVVRLCHIHDISGEGMYIGKHGAGGGIVSNSLFELNVVHDISTSKGDGIELKYEDYNCIVQDNVIYRTELPGVTLYGTARSNPAENNIVRRNAIFQCNDAGIQTTSETTIENNVIFNCPSRGIAVQPNSGAGVDMRYLRIVNNTIYATATVGLKLSNLTNLTPDPIVIANNAIYQVAGGVGLAVNIVGGLPAGTVVAANHYYGDTSGLGGVSGFVAGNAPADEFLSTSVVPGQVNLYPKAGSSLIDSGDNSEAASGDFNKLTARPQNGVADVGAYEVTGATNPGWQIVEGFKRILAGDLDGDCDVDLADVQLFVAAFYGSGTEAGNPLADLDGDGDCDLDDLDQFVAQLSGPATGCP